MILPDLMMVSLPLIAYFILLSTKISVCKDGIAQKNILKSKEIKWENVTSIEKKHLYVLLPQLEKPADIEIKDKNKTRIRAYRFLKNFEEIEQEISRYTKINF